MGMSKPPSIPPQAASEFRPSLPSIRYSPRERRVTVQPSDSSLVWYVPSEYTLTTGDAAFMPPSDAIEVFAVV